ncbi:MAG TPA: leucyl/phenylalanyl-tRNA--protein transferase, partial [Thermoanaerobaculia bacterium]|nr:leucyl/phenylalanyl-tRNA--protein transferase [Thermoanaerobaculia bacterium]
APLPWFSPHRRAVLFFDEIHISRSLARVRRTHAFRMTIDVDFRGVIARCAETPRPDQDGTWIFPEIIDAYVKLHELGHAHSAEVWEGEELVGGIYGVDLGGAFGGESMFYSRPNASKLALLHLAEHLRNRGLGWMDIQVMTPHMEALGAREIPRSEFLDLLKETQERRLVLFP